MVISTVLSGLEVMVPESERSTPTLIVSAARAPKEARPMEERR